MVIVTVDNLSMVVWQKTVVNVGRYTSPMDPMGHKMVNYIMRIYGMVLLGTCWFFMWIFSTGSR